MKTTPNPPRKAAHGRALDPDGASQPAATPSRRRKTPESVPETCAIPGCGKPGYSRQPRVNSLRGYSPMAITARRTHCANGHEYSPENTRICPDGGRDCRTCDRERKRKERAA